MRFGWAAAAAAMVLGAGQASAATWLRYEFAGAGTATRYINNPGGGISVIGPSRQDITISFVIDADQYPLFDYQAVRPTTGLATATATGSAGGIISSGSQNPFTRLFLDYQVNATFAGVAATGGFATSVPSGSASGTMSLNQRFAGQIPENTFYQAAISRVSITRVDDYGVVGISAVPEPATWGMMVAGLGVIGGALRRQSRKRALAALA